jgi:hypothetical protein
MPDDPVVREVRQVRDALARKFNYDVEAIVHDLMARQRQISEGHTIVRHANQSDREVHGSESGRYQ